MNELFHIIFVLAAYETIRQLLKWYARNEWLGFDIIWKDWKKK